MRPMAFTQACMRLYLTISSSGLPRGRIRAQSRSLLGKDTPHLMLVLVTALVRGYRLGS